MKNILLASVAAAALSACNLFQQQAPVADPQVTSTTVSVTEAQGGTTTATTAAAEDPMDMDDEMKDEDAMDDETEVASNDAGTGAVCLATDVLANDLTFIDEGTPVTVSGNSITANGSTHDVSGVAYSTKPC